MCACIAQEHKPYMHTAIFYPFSFVNTQEKAWWLSWWTPEQKSAIKLRLFKNQDMLFKFSYSTFKVNATYHHDDDE